MWTDVKSIDELIKEADTKGWDIVDHRPQTKAEVEADIRKMYEENGWEVADFEIPEELEHDDDDDEELIYQDNEVEAYQSYEYGDITIYNK